MTKATRPASATTFPAGYEVTEPMGAIWSALTDDTNACVLVVDGEGHVLYANSHASSMFGGSPGAAVHSFSDLWEPEVASERRELAAQCAETGRTFVMDGMVRGKLVRTVFRPLPHDAGGKKRVLMVCRLAALNPSQSEAGVLRAKADDSGQLSNLTGREMEILKLIGAGLSTADIAKKLHRSVKTVEWHRVSLGNKLSVTNRVELARIAIGAGLVGLDTPPESAGSDEN